MFTHLLSTEQRSALVQVLAFLAKADGEFSSDEVEFIDAVSRQLGIQKQPVVDGVEVKDLAEILAPVQTDQAKIILLRTNHQQSWFD